MVSIASRPSVYSSKVEEVRQREVRDLGWRKYQTIVVVEFYRVRCPRCGLKSGDRSAVAEQFYFAGIFSQVK